MFDGYVLMLLVMIIVVSLLVIYNVLCFIGVAIKARKYKELSNDEIKQRITDEHFSLNFWWILIRKRIANSSDSADKLKRSTRVINTVNFISTNILTKILSILFALFILAYAMSLILRAASSIFVVIEDKCTCFVQCSGDEADDLKSPYELVFGPTKWQNLKKMYKPYATAEDYEAFEAMSTGKEIGYWCLKHINEEVVEQFRQDCIDRNITKLDGYTVSTMSRDEITNQFKKLMKDYKVHGRGAECPICSNYASKFVHLVCGGVHQYVAPWSFASISDTFDDGDDSINTGPSKAPSSSTIMGNATGKYAVQLDDGMYYWYHQGSDKCVNCDEWSSRTWGQTGIEKNFRANGCAVYSLACIVSNLYGAEITPTVLMNDFGVDTSNGTMYKLAPSTIFTSGVSISRFAAAERIRKKYGLEYSFITVEDHTSAELQQYIDDILGKGGVCWSHWVDSKCDWCSNGTLHFMGIRKAEGDNYYCFTSTASKKTSGGRQGAIDTMNMALAKSSVISSLEHQSSPNHNTIIGFWNPNGGGGQGGQVGQGGYNLSASDQELISWFKSDLGVSDQKAYGMLACYKAATDSGLSTYETVGLLGCAMAEGSPGLVQYGFSLNGYGKSSQSSPVIVNTTSKVNVWINNIVQSRGCGTAQWTDTLYRGSWSYRGRTYIEYIKKYTTDTECDYKTLWSADYDMYKMELTGSYKSIVTDMPKHNSSVESITVFSMFKYEAGWANYKNTDKINDYSGTFKSYLDTRYKNALAVDKMFRKHAN